MQNLDFVFLATLLNSSYVGKHILIVNVWYCCYFYHAIWGGTQYPWLMTPCCWKSTVMSAGGLKWTKGTANVLTKVYARHWAACTETRNFRSGYQWHQEEIMARNCKCSEQLCMVKVTGTRVILEKPKLHDPVEEFHSNSWWKSEVKPNVSEYVYMTQLRWLGTMP